MSVSTRIDWNTLSSITRVAVRAKLHLRWLPAPRGFLLCGVIWEGWIFREAFFFYGAFHFHSPHVFRKKKTFSIRPGRLLSAHISIILVSHRRWNSQSAIWMRIHPALALISFCLCVSACSGAHALMCPPFCTPSPYTHWYSWSGVISVYLCEATNPKRQNSAVQSTF